MRSRAYTLSHCDCNSVQCSHHTNSVTFLQTRCGSTLSHFMQQAHRWSVRMYVAFECLWQWWWGGSSSPSLLLFLFLFLSSLSASHLHFDVAGGGGFSVILSSEGRSVGGSDRELDDSLHGFSVAPAAPHLCNSPFRAGPTPVKPSAAGVDCSFQPLCGIVCTGQEDHQQEQCCCCCCCTCKTANFAVVDVVEEVNLELQGSVMFF